MQGIYYSLNASIPDNNLCLTSSASSRVSTCCPGKNRKKKLKKFKEFKSSRSSKARTDITDFTDNENKNLKNSFAQVETASNG